MKIPMENCAFNYDSLKFNGCVFTATDDYMAARWGRKLHSTDRDWMAAHPNATDDGVPMEYMPTVIHEMLEPYGMGVARVRVRRGMLAAGDALTRFMDSLGVNPFGRVDRTTANAEAALKLGMTEAEADAMFRFEFHDEPLPGCTIIGEKGWSSNTQTNVSVGNAGGHARYLAPRAKEGNWGISIQVAPKEQIAEYTVPIETTEYKARQGTATLKLSGVLRPDGKLVGIMLGAKFKSPEFIENTKSSPAPTTPAAADTHGTGKEWMDSAKGAQPFQTKVQVLQEHGRSLQAPQEGLDGRFIEITESGDAILNCDICGAPKPWKELTAGTAICTDCYNSCWDGLVCPECKKPLSDGNSPWFTEKYEDDGSALFKCAHEDCDANLLVSPKNPDIPIELVALLEFLYGTAEAFEETLWEEIKDAAEEQEAWDEMEEQEDLDDAIAAGMTLDEYYNGFDEDAEKAMNARSLRSIDPADADDPTDPWAEYDRWAAENEVDTEARTSGVDRHVPRSKAKKKGRAVTPKAEALDPPSGPFTDGTSITH
jgi:hypothetical protein